MKELYFKNSLIDKTWRYEVYKYERDYSITEEKQVREILLNNPYLVFIGIVDPKEIKWIQEERDVKKNIFKK